MSTKTGMEFSRNRLVVWAIAGLLALMISYAPVALDVVAGTSLTTQAYACQAAGGGC